VDRSLPHVSSLRRTAAPACRCRRRPTQSLPVRRGLGVKWNRRENAKNLTLAPDLEAPNRIGPPDLWAKFDTAQTRFGDALAGDSLVAIAQAFGDIAQAVTDIADALDSNETG
jgi:hypothetical protein